MGAVILFCRAFPFLFFSGSQTPLSEGKKIFLDFAERIAPPAAMTVLVFNSLGPSIKTMAAAVGRGISSLLVYSAEFQRPGNFSVSAAALMAAFFTALIHIWKRNSLISIFGGTAVYMILQNII